MSLALQLGGTGDPVVPLPGSPWGRFGNGARRTCCRRDVNTRLWK